MENSRVELRLYVDVNVAMKFHSLDDDLEVELNLDEFHGVTDRDGKTWISYHTDWEDCPTSGFYIKESVDEVKEIVNEAVKLRADSYDKYEVVEKKDNR